MKLVLAASFLALATSAALATTQRYSCTITYPEIGASKGVNMVIARVAGSNDAMVVDGIAMAHNNGAPYLAKVDSENDRRITFVWKTGKLNDDDGQATQLAMRATWVKATGRMNVNMKPLGGYNNHFQGQGPCEVTQVK